MKENVSQKQAIEHDKGPMMVLAGPGSGKTFVITNRTKYLIEHCGANPYNILVITFTKASAQEMKERFISIAGESGKAVNFGTFHSMFFTILRHAYNYNASNIIRSEQKQQILKEVVDRYHIETEDEKELISLIESEISMVKGELMPIENYYSQSCSEETFRKIYGEYNSRLRDLRLLDFDDMISQCYKLFIAHPDILAAWQSKFQYILIDEFQDINMMQYEIVKMLAKPDNNIFIVGDDDQSIYRFRGAKPEIMMNFTKDYPNAKKILLDVNYRSTGCIVDSASKVIKNNQSRFGKDIFAANGEGEPVKIVEFKSALDENKRIINEINEYQQKGINLSDMAVLYRTNTQPRALVEKLMEYNITFTIKDAIPSLYEHWIAKNIIGYIDAARQFCNIDDNRDKKKDCVDRVIMLNIANRPKRYIGRDSMPDNVVDFIKLKNFYIDKDWMIDRIDKLEYDLKMIAKVKPFAAISYIRNAVGYEEYLKEYAAFKKISEEDLMDILDELTESSKNFETYEEWMKHIKEYEMKLLIMQRERSKKKEGVNLTTFHGSKGLEFTVVFIIDANEGITPHKKSVTDEDLEEERRMFYVAMTRAKSFLHVYYIKERYKKALDVSRFVGEIIVDKSLLVKGTIIEHIRFGKGEIQKREDNKITIKFEKLIGNRILDIDYCVGNRIININQMVTKRLQNGTNLL